MKAYFLLAQFFCCFALLAQPINIPFGGKVFCDGNPLQEEWADADSLFINLPEGGKIKVKFKHDGKHLFISYFAESPGAISVFFPEVMIDTKNTKTKSWEKGQWWFHVSATDCASEAAPSSYSDCKHTGNGWQAQPNFVNGEAPPTIFEIEISFAKLGIIWQDQVTKIGLAFSINKMMRDFIYWPASAAINNPSSWATAILQTTK